MQSPSEWQGTNPYFLLIVLKDRRWAKIDLDEREWLKRYAGFMRAPGQWYLCRKPDQFVVATMLVHEGEQPYYVARHVGFITDDTGPKGETINYGIGKKRLDGHVDRLWVMSNGSVTLGDDGEEIALDLLKSGLI